jgi:hypothetical protein
MRFMEIATDLNGEHDSFEEAETRQNAIKGLYTQRLSEDVQLSEARLDMR